MHNNKIKFGLVISLLLVMGAGCTSKETIEQTPVKKQEETKVLDITTDKKEEKVSSSSMIDNSVTGKGEVNTTFRYMEDSSSLKVEIINNGVKRLGYKIKFHDKGLIIKQGKLEPKEKYSELFKAKDLQKGDYYIELNQENGQDILAYLKTELKN